MKFRDDIDPATTWVISDTHFGHDNIVGFCHRPEDHEQAIIAEWRKAVPDDATVLHLGDLAYRNNARFKHLLARELTGQRKLIILGNHDNQRFSFFGQSGFKVVRPFKLRVKMDHPGRGVKVASQEDNFDHHRHAEVSFSHYAWNASDEGFRSPWEWRVHGHIHNNGYTRDGFVPYLLNHINVSAEMLRYTPANLGLLLDAAIWGRYPETTDEQQAEARARKEANLNAR